MKSSSEYSAAFRLQEEIVPLLALQEVFCFPQQVQLLNVFAARHRKLISDVMQTDQLFVLHGIDALGMNTSNAVAPLCLVRIISSQRPADGGFLLLVEGLSRVILLEEMSNSNSYLSARIHIATDIAPVYTLVDREERRRELLEISHLLYPQAIEGETVQDQYNSELTLGETCDILAASIAKEIAGELLAERKVDARSEILLTFLRRLLIEKVSGNQPARHGLCFSLN